MICPNCGMELEDGTPVCPLCEYEFFGMEFNESGFETGQPQIGDSGFENPDIQFGTESDRYENTGSQFGMNNIGNEQAGSGFGMDDIGNEQAGSGFGMNDIGNEQAGSGFWINDGGNGTIKTGFAMNDREKETVQTGFKMDAGKNENAGYEVGISDRGSTIAGNGFGMHDEENGIAETGFGMNDERNGTAGSKFGMNDEENGKIENQFGMNHVGYDSVGTGFDINEDAPVDMSGRQNEFRDLNNQSGKNNSGKKIVIGCSIIMVIAVVAAGIIMFVKNKNSDKENESEIQMNMDLDEDGYARDVDNQEDVPEEEQTDVEDETGESNESVENESLKETEESTSAANETTGKITWTTEKDIRTEKYGSTTVTYSFDMVKLPEQYAVANAKLEQIHQEGKLKGDELFSYTDGLWQQSYADDWVCTYTLKSVSIRQEYISVVWEWEWYAGGVREQEYEVVNYDISSGNTVTAEQILNMDSNQAKNHIISRTFEYLQKNSMMNAYNECNTGMQRTIADYNTSEFNVYFDDAHIYVCYASWELFEMGGLVTVVPLDGENTVASNQTAQNNSNTNSYAGITTGNSSYILPNSSNQYLTMTDLQGLTAEQCRIARNEIYARHGRKFDDAALQAYFNSCSWYTGTVEPKDFTDSMLNNFEIANKDLIIQYETNMGYR